MTTMGIRDVSDQDFVPLVLERSRELPVVVDFWAPWCAPCRLLGPILERLIAARAGQIELARVNTDENPYVAQQYGIQGIPAVKAFRDGRVVSEFTGALPEAQVQSFLAQLLPSHADQLAESAVRLAYAGKPAEAEAEYRRALEEDRSHPAATVGLARLLVARGASEEARQLLENLPGDSEAQRLRAELNLKRDGVGADVAELEQRALANPNDVDTRFQLGLAMAAKGEYEPALEQLLEVVRRDRAYQEDAGRKAMLDIFALLGDTHPLTRSFRRRLSNILF